MIASAGVPYESLPFLNVFSPEYAKNPLGAIAELGAGHVLARSPRGLECLSYDLSWELLRDERFPVGFEELLIMGGIAPESASRSYCRRPRAPAASQLPCGARPMRCGASRTFRSISVALGRC